MQLEEKETFFEQKQTEIIGLQINFSQDTHLKKMLTGLIFKMIFFFFFANQLKISQIFEKVILDN